MVLEELNLFPNIQGNIVKALFLNFGDENSLYSMNAMDKLRENNISTELYPDNLSIKKQLNYANNNNIPYVVFVGDEELKSKKYNLKEMNTGNQELLTISQLIKKLSEQK